MRTIETAGAPAHKGPVPQAVEVDGWVFVSALFGADPETGQIPDTAEAEAVQLFANLNAILRAAGGDLSDVVRVGIFTTHLQRDRPALNEVWKRTFGDHRPARSAVEVAAFGRPGDDPRFMVEVTARVRDATGRTDPS
jgi:2-iminobutanoate/2-iminopropanoate deaminase